MVDVARAQLPANMSHTSQPMVPSTLESFATDALDWVKLYARDKPVSFALWSMGIGFVLGWKLKPW